MKEFESADIQVKNKIAKLQVKIQTMKGRDRLGDQVVDTDGNAISLDKLHELLSELNKLIASTDLAERQKARVELQALIQMNHSILDWEKKQWNMN